MLNLTSRPKVVMGRATPPEELEPARHDTEFSIDALLYSTLLYQPVRRPLCKASRMVVEDPLMGLRMRILKNSGKLVYMYLCMHASSWMGEQTLTWAVLIGT